MSGTSGIRRFAPLGKPNDRDEGGTNVPVRLRGIVFDMDGTLCEPQNYMFGQMRAAVEIPATSDILDHIHALPADAQVRAFARIQAIEREAMAKQVPQPGLVELLEYLDRRQIRRGICTRNFDAPVDHLLQTHVPSHVNPFSPIITRDFRPPKPSPAGILHIAHAWGLTDAVAGVKLDLPPAERPLPILMVGDSVDDMISGYEAGAMTVLLRSEGKEELEADFRTHVVISRLDELIELLDNGISSMR